MRTFTDHTRTATVNVLRDLGLIVGELLRDLACAMLCAALVLYVIALYSGGVFQTTLSHAEACPNAAFRVGPSAALPDCRAYEQVTPVEKNGGYINEGGFSSSPEGESAAFTSNSGFAGATSNLDTSTGYQASRGSFGWVTTAQTQSEARFIDNHHILSSDYLAESFGDVDYRLPGTEGAARIYLLQEASKPEADLDFYVNRPEVGNVEVGPAVPPTASGLPKGELEESKYINTLGLSADGSHLVFEDPEPAGPNQWSFGAPGALLGYSGSGKSEPELIGVDDSGQFVNGCSHQLLGGIAPGAPGQFNGAASEFNFIANPISSDGKRIFFTDACRGGLFARINSGEADVYTVSISEPTSADCAACDVEAGVQQPAEFVGASEDGSKVFFNTSQPLLDGTGGLYEYDFDTTEGPKVTLAVPGEVSVQQTSEDGSHVYFFSTSVLTEEPSPSVRGRNRTGQSVDSNAVAQLGEKNLYVFERDARYPSGHVGFVATLQPDDQRGAKGETALGNVTPNGRYFVFVSYAQLTTGDSSTAAQVFEYDSLTAGLIRVSKGDDGYNNDGNSYLSYPGSAFREEVGGAGGLIDANNANITGRNGKTESSYFPSAYSYHLSVSEDGQYVYFVSPIALTPGALNRVLVGTEASSGRVPLASFAENVYEYHAGHVFLISDGQDTSMHLGASQVHLLTTDLSGRDVFFETTDSLVGQDTDSNKDIYDARIDGGFPAPALVPTCQGDACQGQLSPSPVLLSPGSEFQAGGNPPLAAPTLVTSTKAKPKAKPKAKKCKRGTTLKHGRCVKQGTKRSTRRAK